MKISMKSLTLWIILSSMKDDSVEFFNVVYTGKIQFIHVY